MEQISITSAYMWAIVIMVAFFLLAVIISNLILFKPNNSGTTTRRIWFRYFVWQLVSLDLSSTSSLVKVSPFLAYKAIILCTP